MTRISALWWGAGAMAALAPAAFGQTLHLEQSRITGHGNTIAINRVAITLPTGTVYRDVRIELSADAAGTISIRLPHEAARPVVSRPAAPLVVSRPSPPLVARRFATGTYRTADGGGLYNVIDLGVPFGHQTPRYKLAAIGAGGAVLDGATWDSGPFELNGLRSRLENAGITDVALSYGTSDGGSGGPFEDGALLGFSERGGHLVIQSFRRGCCSDTATPQAILELDHVGS